MKHVVIPNILLFSYSLYAQKIFLPGHVITASGDTLEGYINDRNIGTFNSSLYRKVRFKTNERSRVRKYRAEQIKSYERGGTKFITVEEHKLDNNPLIESNYVPRKQNMVFLKVIDDSHLNYYHLEWIDEDNADVRTTDYFKKQNKTNYVRVTQGIFGLKKKRLIKFFHDCPELQGKIRSEEFKTPEEILRFYNNWVDKE